MWSKGMGKKAKGYMLFLLGRNQDGTLQGAAPGLGWIVFYVAFLNSLIFSARSFVFRLFLTPALRLA